MGHARALISIENEDKQLEIYNSIVLNDLSVRDVEDLARGVKTEVPARNTTSGAAKKAEKGALTFEQQQVVEDLRSVFNAKVQISKESNGKGKIVIPFRSDNDLRRILDLLDA